MTESSDSPAKPQDYAGLRAELTKLVNDFLPLINELWPRLEDHEDRWELHSYGLAEGHGKLVVAKIIGLLVEALKGIGATDNKLLQLTRKPTSTIPAAPTPPDQAPPHSAVSGFPIG